MKVTNKCKVHKKFEGEVCPVCLHEEWQKDEKYICEIKHRIREAVYAIKNIDSQNVRIGDFLDIMYKHFREEMKE